MSHRQTTPATWVSWREAARMFASGATVSSAAPIAFIVGTWLSLMNQGDLILAGSIPWAKVAMNYATPFVVASLGFLAARRRRNVESLAALLGAERERQPTRGDD